MAQVGRARRVRKVVDYASFADGDESDDDFVSSSTPPVAKKPKLDKPDKTSKLKSRKTEKENAKKKEKKSLNRRPPGEDLFESDLQAALHLSMIDTSSQETGEESDVKAVVKPVVIDDDNDEIVCLGSEPIPSPSPAQSSRRAASKAVEQRQSFLQESESEGPSQDKPDDDEEFRLEGDDSEDDEDDESDDSFDPDNDDDDDFDDRKKKKKGKEMKKQPAKPKPQKTPKPAKPAAKKPTKAAASTPSHPKPITKEVSKSSPSPFRSPLASNSLPASNTPKPDLGTGVGRQAAWTPPAPIGSAAKSVNLGGISIKSPSVGGGGLRLGLSRSQRVKPLHSSVKGAR